MFLFAELNVEISHLAFQTLAGWMASIRIGYLGLDVELVRRSKRDSSGANVINKIYNSITMPCRWSEVVLMW